MESRVIDELYRIIEDRKINPRDNSYTCHLFREGRDKILRKVSEEATEVILASKSENKEETVKELADLFYHLLVLMCNDQISLDDVYGELKSRMKT